MIIAMMRSGFSNIQWTIEDMITENDKVAVRFTMRGTHQGTFFGVTTTDRKKWIISDYEFLSLG